MSENDIQELIQRFLQLSDWGYVLKQTNGKGYCYDASEDLRKWLLTEIDPSINAYLHYEPYVGQGTLSELYPKSSGAHWVLVLNNEWLVDLTARQFDKALPLPYVQKIHHFLRRVP